MESEEVSEEKAAFLAAFLVALLAVVRTGPFPMMEPQVEPKVCSAMVKGTEMSCLTGEVRAVADVIPGVRSVEKMVAEVSLAVINVETPTLAMKQALAAAARTAARAVVLEAVKALIQE